MSGLYPFVLKEFRASLTYLEIYINTIDIENIKTILASNFKDFGLGQRQDAFGPMLGQGIFTTGKSLGCDETV